MTREIKKTRTALRQERGSIFTISGLDCRVAIIHHAETDRLTLMIENINRLGYRYFDELVEACSASMDGVQPFCKYRAGNEPVTILEWSRNPETIEGFLTMMVNSGNGFLSGGCEDITYAGNFEPAKYYDAAMSQRFAIRTAAL